MRQTVMQADEQGNHTCCCCPQVLDTGLGTPKHPLFLFGKKYSDADRQSPQATAARARIGSLRSWYARRLAASRADTAAVPSHRHSRVMQNPRQILDMVPQHPAGPQPALPVPSSASFSCASPLRQRMTHGQQVSTQAAVSAGSATHAPGNTTTSMQLNADVLNPSWTGRPHPTHPSTARPLPGTNADADAATAHTSACPPEQAIDLEAQNCPHFTPQSSPANVATAVSDVGHGSNAHGQGYDSGYDSGYSTGHGSGGDAADEPADVAAERAKADRLWAAGAMHIAGATAVAGPAILLHNLRKVCQLPSIKQMTASNC